MTGAARGPVRCGGRSLAHEAEPQRPRRARDRVERIGAADATIAPGSAGDGTRSADGTVDGFCTSLGLDLSLGQVKRARALGAAIGEVPGNRNAYNLSRTEALASPGQVVLFDNHVAW